MRRPRKTYETPSKRWDKTRIDEESKLLKNFGLKNKRELWKAKATVKKFRTLARKMFVDATGKEEMFAKLRRMGIFNKEITLDDVLSMTVENVLERRLQTQVMRKGLAQTANQARQMITHRHITVDGKIVDIPSYPVNTEMEQKIAYSGSSKLSKADHPLRSTLTPEEIEKRNKRKEEREKKAAMNRRGRRPRGGDRI
jgi:small subunit ribosomal protein S4